MNTDQHSKTSRPDILKHLLGFLDLTTLEGADTEEKVRQLCRKAAGFHAQGEGFPDAAAVCVYPTLVKTARLALEGTDVRVASVAGAFPSGQSDLQIKLREMEYAIREGADELDIVISRGKFLEGLYDEVYDELVAARDVARKVTLKVILETGELISTEKIRKASEIAIRAGADFIKTSTGKIPIGATPEAAGIMLQAIRDHYRETGKKVGFKPAGGVSEPDRAIGYYQQVQEILGDEWLTRELFRMGASRLADNILKELSGTSGLQ